jgi:hypothetical protein
MCSVLDLLMAGCKCASGDKGDGKDPGCCKAFCFPMVSVVQAQGSARACPECCIASIPTVGSFYAACFWRFNIKLPPTIAALRKQNQAEEAAWANRTQIVPGNTGNAK